MTGQLEGKTALITGAGSGLGQTMAQLFAKEGACVLATDQNADGLAKTKALLDGSSAPYDICGHDVTQQADWDAAIEAAFALDGRLDILVNNAGVATLKTFDKMSLEDFRAVNAVNLHGPFIGARTAVAALRKHADGVSVHASIINITSIAASRALPTWAAYGTSKAALANLTKALAVELGHKGEFIRVNAAAPGPVRTPMTEVMDGVGWEERDHSILGLIPLSRYGQQDEIAKAALYLASDRSKFVTGATIPVDGGWGGM